MRVLALVYALAALAYIGWCWAGAPGAPMREQTEAQFQAVVMDVARFNGWRVFHVHDSRREVRPGFLVGDRDAKGFPDLVLLRERLIVRELKTDTGRLRSEQAEWLRRFHLAGVDAAVWRPKDWPRIEAELARSAA